jgi:transcriptional regulator with XRE-family HTH domain
VTEAWYVWMATFGSHVATLRRFLGLTEADLARESGVTEGQVRRFEAGKRLRRIDPDLLAPEAKGFLQHLDFLAMPDEDGPPAPGGVPVAEFRIIQDPAIEELVLRFRALDRAGRRAFLQIMRAVAQALRE